ncbi:MAG: hypothetical protein VW907_03665 [Opitutae bacterium]
MSQKNKEQTADLFEYKILFKLDEQATFAHRHYLAHNARDALGMFAYSMLKSLFDRKTFVKQEFIIAREFVKLYDQSLQSPKFQLAEKKDFTKLKKQPKYPRGSNQKTLDSINKIVEEMNRRIELIKFMEYNRWANRWYTLRLPLEEITPE